MYAFSGRRRQGYHKIFISVKKYPHEKLSHLKFMLPAATTTAGIPYASSLLKPSP